ncbi:hypothetical protein L9F63_027471 [Diploptera punctata]|uniref:Ubiquitin-like protease family profile domain-containing protein n=1 Tax=Diploptera punctata TaxID=6984 RepID=A0AAD8A8L4_DIPPU|nr:hypothetical protein L9F63_027471 [Diploptera punctata]
MGAHWCVAVADVREKTLKYYDSLEAAIDKCLKILMKYLTDERVARKVPVHVWKTENAQNLPQQMNGSDCGVLSCMYAEFICRNADFTFAQKDIPYFRHKMIYEIYRCKLLM